MTDGVNGTEIKHNSKTVTIRIVNEEVAAAKPGAAHKPPNVFSLVGNLDG